MPTEPEVPTVSEIVKVAADAADPTGADDAVAEFFARFEDRDEPVTAVTDTVADEFIEMARAIDLDGDSKALDAAVKVATYLVFRPVQIGTDRAELIRLAERAESNR